MDGWNRCAVMVLLVTAAVLACAPSTPTPGPRALSPVPSLAPSSVPPEAQALVQDAKRMLSTQIGVSEAEITVVSVEARDWPDASLGCPQPGFGYAQVVTPGYRIVLEARGQRYAFHTSTSTVVYCPNDRP